MAGTLVIVESPSKAKTISKYLGAGYTVYASKGHVRDLPEKGLGIDVDSGTFQPDYKIKKGQWETITRIKEAARNASNVLLATDPDREGEAIAWHILIAAGLSRSNVRRVEFHEITANAIKKAIANPRSIDMNLVNAQQARRVLDRLVGYKISPLLWNKIQKGLSAGRVQSVALRIIAEREQEIEEFVPREFWTVEANLAKHPFGGSKSEVFRAILWDKSAKSDDKNNSEEKDAAKRAKGKKMELENGDAAKAVVKALDGAKWTVANLIKEPSKRYPSAPFTTSTLQQEASRKLHFLAKRTMQVAQQLYEGVNVGPEGTVGLITYMRTDSTQVAYEAQTAAREVIEKVFGPEYLPSRPPQYTKKAANAQEAHEAIRPTVASREPDKIQAYLTNEQYLLYRLIWQRFIASQMVPAEIENTIADINAQPKATELPPYLFRATGLRITFPGFMVVYKIGLGDGDNSLDKTLPPLTNGDLLDALLVEPLQHFTQPPPRFSEATLVKTLEELGVGRPSTYATILSTIQERGYVVKASDKIKGNDETDETASKGRGEQRFHPTALGRAVNNLLVARFPDIVDVKFTAKMEQELDEVASGERNWTPLVAAFYKPMMQKLAEAEREVAKISVPLDENLPTTNSNGYKRGYGGRRGSYGSSTNTAKNYSRRTNNKTTYGVSEEKSTYTATNRRVAATAETAEKPTATRSRKAVAETDETSQTATTTSRRRKSSTATPEENFVAAVTNPKKATRTRKKTENAATTLAEPPVQTATPTNVATSNQTSVTCDKCGKTMVKRKGPYSEFWGCTGYPNCRNTRKI